MIADRTVSRRRPKSFDQCVKVIGAGPADFIVGQPKRMTPVARQVLDDPSQVHVESHVLSHTSFHLMLDPDADGFVRRMRRANEAIAAARETEMNDILFAPATP